MDWLRTLPTVKYSYACCEMKTLQGKKKTWFCGAHVHALEDQKDFNIPSLWQDNALKSGVNAAEDIISFFQKE